MSPRARSPWPAPCLLPPPRLLQTRHGDARRPCPLSLTRCSLSPPLALSPELTRGPPSLPLAAAAPRATARLSVVSRRTAPSPYSSSPRHTGREALLHPEHCRLLPRDPAIAVVAPSSAGLPRARRVLQSTRCEPPVIFPLTPRPFAHRSRRVHRGRTSPPSELVAGVAPVTLWSAESGYGSGATAGVGPRRLATRGLPEPTTTTMTCRTGQNWARESAGLYERERAMQASGDLERASECVRDRERRGRGPH